MKLEKSIDKRPFAVKFEVKENEEVLGWAFLYIIFQDRHEEPYGFLENVYVEKEHRSKGIGSQLMEEAIKEAKERNCYKLIFTSRAVNEKAHSFYKKFGFQKWGYEFRLDLLDSKPKQED